MQSAKSRWDAGSGRSGRGHAAGVGIEFTNSDPLTLGIEEEFLVVEAVDGVTPAPRADALLEGSWDTVASPGGWFKAELLRSSIEVATAPNARLIQLDVDLRALREELVVRAEANGLALVALGMHPALDARLDDITPSEAHEGIARLHARVGTLADQVTHGIHVHVGVPDLDAAVAVMQALAAHVSVFIAATAHSPVTHGERSTWRSARSEVQRRMLWAGPTPRFASTEEYEVVHALHQLENTGDQRFLWEVAPVPALGTVEVRTFDSHPDPRVALGMAALVQGIAAHVLDGGEVARSNESLERHNRWSAMEFGPRARFLVPGHDQPVDAPEIIRAAVELAHPYSRDLGNEEWLDVVEELIQRPPVDAAIDAFEAGGVADLMAYGRLRATGAARE
ncbi:MAG: Enzymatic protein of unknown function [Thermoleophilia bacterium]|nr:Enzymatic protein of unknown function [Thermoleophilia bacterium]